MSLFLSSVVCGMIQSTTQGEKHCGRNKPLPDISLDFQQDFTVPNWTGKFAVETSVDPDEVGRDSICS